jgi:hypothetical protein
MPINGIEQRPPINFQPFLPSEKWQWMPTACCAVKLVELSITNRQVKEMTYFASAVICAPCLRYLTPRLTPTTPTAERLCACKDMRIFFP